MAKVTQRYSFALERLRPEDWAIFERFASRFLVSDYGQIRTVGAPEGDGGRDAELFAPAGETPVVLQYSVTEDWRTKIKKTARRIKNNFANATILIYVTNQKVGAKADDLKKELRENHSLILDIHDRSWFLDRSVGDRQQMVEELAVAVVDPYLASKEIIESKAPSVTTTEAKAAIVHLQLQWEDDTRDKGLTRLSYEALVRAVLRETTSERRVPRERVKEQIRALLPQIESTIVDTNVDSVLGKLEKAEIVRRHQKVDEVCLAHEEVLKVRNQLAIREQLFSDLLAEIGTILKDIGAEQPNLNDYISDLAARVRRVVDRFLQLQGEQFASQVLKGQLALVEDDLNSVVANDYAANRDRSAIGAAGPDLVRKAAAELLRGASPKVHAYLRGVADAYTLFAFLRLTPDVQDVVKKIFSDATIWLDTSVLLPVLAETLVPEEEQRISRLLKAARQAGLRLRVTAGVVEEIWGHLNKCIVYGNAAAGSWRGHVPFLYSIYGIAGRDRAAFRSWTVEFCGPERPLDDIADYLDEKWGIRIESLETAAASAPEAMRQAVDRAWQRVHETRRRDNENDSNAVARLARHDSENFLGVVHKRLTSSGSALGFAYWWLTIDSTVREIQQQLEEELGSSTPKSPVMSPDFLSNYLSVRTTCLSVQFAAGFLRTLNNKCRYRCLICCLITYRPNCSNWPSRSETSALVLTND